MADHFEKIQKLPDPIVGCPNFPRIPGYKVYCCGQPTAEGFKNCLEKVCGTIYPKDGKIIWVNMRQEPNVYINGEPVCARSLSIVCLASSKCGWSGRQTRSGSTLSWAM